MASVPWFEDSAIEDQVDVLLGGDLAWPELSPFAEFVASQDPQSRTEASELLDDAIFDLTRLIEEYRFGTAVALTYLHSSREARMNLKEERTAGLRAVPLSSTVKALLAPYLGAVPQPRQLIEDPSALISGSRVLGGWWSAQLIDSTLLRGLAALDRVASILFVAAHLRVDPDRMPAFRKDELRKLRGHYAGDDWDVLFGLSTDELFLWIKNYRDGYIHRRRFPMELHGDLTTMLADNSITLGIDASTHFAFVTGFYGHVLRPACEAGARLLSARG